MHSKSLTPKAFSHLQQALMSLSGVGEQSAQRMLHSCLQEGKASVLQEALEQAQKLQLCQTCHAYSETPICSLCQDATRNAHPFALVLSMHDRAELIRQQHLGQLFVLSNLLMPSAGLGLKETGMAQMLERVKALQVTKLYAVFPSGSRANLSLQFLADTLAESVQLIHVEDIALWQSKQKK